MVRMKPRIRRLLSRAVVLFGALVLVLAGAASARAQSKAEPVTEAELDRPLMEPPRDPGEESKRRAAELFNEGLDLANRGKTREALRVFRSAYERHGTTDALANVAALELKLGKSRAAAEHLTHALERLLIIHAAEVRADLRKRLAEAKALVGTVELATDLHRTELQWNATWLGTGPLRRAVYVDPGTEHLLIARYGGVEHRRKLRLSKGETVRIELTEADFPGAAPPASAAIVEASESGDGKPTPDAASSRLPWILAGSAAAVVFAGTAAVGFAGAVVADSERTKIDRDIQRLGGTCGPPPVPGFVDDCRARDQEAGNHTINLGIGIAGAALAAGAVAVTLGVAFKVPEKNLSVLPGPGGVWVRGRF